ncbi:uncharacterized protein LOC129976393 [Argiope bruennichi]|uniref:Uncharacterized protein n=1 Tax=Argiope bruennichi TaxID=94029 RepID=A0A8T0ESE8_ARGBR|nr:uncharacterized protein LOC129976375 [Argiope bruennichi]XP_055945904.1 uncharacterized protein LOC129976393 [Argiope bruennichi]KAF8778667.1 hypothetical protein HNY73_015368 [Argiope bruennichi]
MGKGRKKNRNTDKKQSKKTQGNLQSTPLQKSPQSPNVTESNVKKESKKTQENLQSTPPQRSPQSPNVTESIQEEESNVKGTDIVLLQEGEPRKLYQGQIEIDGEEHDILSFILHSLWAMICLIAAIHIVIMVTTDGLLSIDFGETRWTIGIILCIVFLMTVASTLLAMIKLPDFLEYIFRCASVINFFVIVAFTANILFRINLYLITSDEACVKIACWICTIWVTSVTSMALTFLLMRDTFNLKMQVLEFYEFITKYALSFYFFINLLKFVARSYDNIYFGIKYEETFWKFVNGLCYIVITVVCICCALFYQYIDW